MFPFGGVLGWLAPAAGALAALIVPVPVAARVVVGLGVFIVALILVAVLKVIFFILLVIGLIVGVAFVGSWLSKIGDEPDIAPRHEE